MGRTKKKGILDDEELPDEKDLVNPSNDNDGIAGDAGTPAVTDNGAEPAPAPSSDYDNTDGVFDAAISSISSAYKTAEHLQDSIDMTNYKLSTSYHMLDGLGRQCGNVVSGIVKVNEVYGKIEAQWVMTRPQMRQFEDGIAEHIKGRLQTETKIIIDDTLSEMRQIRREQVRKFTYDVNGGMWISSKCGAWIVGIIVFSYFIMIIWIVWKFN